MPPLRIWRNEIFKHFDHRYTNGFLESKNKRIKVIKRVAYHFQKDRRAANSKQRILLRKRRELYAKAA